MRQEEMTQIFRARNRVLQNFALAFVLFIAGLMAVSLLPTSLNAEPTQYSAISFLIVSCLISYVLWAFSVVNARITTSQSGITRRTFLGESHFQWDEIAEIGRIQQWFGYAASWKY